MSCLCYEKLPKSTIHNSAFPKKVPTLKGAILAFIKTLCTLGKLIEVRKRREKDKKANTLAKQGKKTFISLDLKMTSDVLMHVFRLSLPGVFKIIPSLGSEFSGVLSFYHVVFLEISTKRKSKENYHRF